jgi:hypothetical protein
MPSVMRHLFLLIFNRSQINSFTNTPTFLPLSLQNMKITFCILVLATSGWARPPTDHYESEEYRDNNIMSLQEEPEMYDMEKEERSEYVEM